MRETRVKVHPRSGAVWAPIGYRGNGNPIWPILGGAEEDDSGEGDQDDKDEGDGEEDNDDESEDTSGDKDESASGTVSAEEFNKLQERMKNADRRANKAEEALKTKERAELDDKTRAEKERDDAIAERDKAKEQLQRAKINNAFLTNNKHNWHNPDRALRLLDLSEVEVNDEGEVIGMVEAIESLAKSDPYLIKTDADDDEGKGGAPSGTSVGSNGKTKDKGKLDRAALEKKYPALRK